MSNKSKLAKIDNVLVIGVGLIGGSLATVLRESNQFEKVTGYGRNQEKLDKALEMKVIDHTSSDLTSAASSADLIILAVPISITLDVISFLADIISKDTIITDVGSVKKNIVSSAKEKLGKNFKNFVPGHPIAGSEKSGVDASNRKLFNDHWTILTPTNETSSDAIQVVEEVWKLAGSKILKMDADTHDQILGMTSHLPHVIAYALMIQLAEQPDFTACLSLAAGGFYDTSRIASSDPSMWSDIFLHNKENTIDHIRKFKDILLIIEKRIMNDDREQLEKMFNCAKVNRDKIKRSSRSDY